VQPRPAAALRPAPAGRAAATAPEPLGLGAVEMVRWLGGSTLLASGPGAVAVVACVVPPELESNAESTVASMRVEHYPPAPEGVAAVLCTAIGGGWRMAEG